MPTIPLTEPVSPRYIHINSGTNRVHLLVPVVGGQEISTDNTCKATVALKEFDEKTKALMLKRVSTIEATGLPFQQNGEEHRSAHFDLTELKTALKAYIDGFDALYAANNWAALEAAWMVVGKTQRAYRPIL